MLLLGVELTSLSNKADNKSLTTLPPEEVMIEEGVLAMVEISGASPNADTNSSMILFGRDIVTVDFKVVVTTIFEVEG